VTLLSYFYFSIVSNSALHMHLPPRSHSASWWDFLPFPCVRTFHVSISFSSTCTSQFHLFHLGGNATPLNSPRHHPSLLSCPFQALLAIPLTWVRSPTSSTTLHFWHSSLLVPFISGDWNYAGAEKASQSVIMYLD
jgi:hypothetical protein